MCRQRLGCTEVVTLVSVKSGWGSGSGLRALQGCVRFYECRCRQRSWLELREAMCTRFSVSSCVNPVGLLGCWVKGGSHGNCSCLGQSGARRRCLAGDVGIVGCALCISSARVGLALVLGRSLYMSMQ